MRFSALVLFVLTVCSCAKANGGDDSGASGSAPAPAGHAGEPCLPPDRVGCYEPFVCYTHEGTAGQGKCIDPTSTGAERQPCFDNGTCYMPLTCIDDICVDLGDGGLPDASGGSGGTAGQGGAAGSSNDAGAGGANSGTGGSDSFGGSSSGSGGSDVGGAAGDAGTGGSSAGLSGSSGAGGSCVAPGHLCGGTCAGNTPDTGCTNSGVACTPCFKPDHGTAQCTPSGMCTFVCDPGFMMTAQDCVAGAAGSGGTGGGPCQFCTNAGSSCNGTDDFTCAEMCSKSCPNKWSCTYVSASNTCTCGTCP